MQPVLTTTSQSYILSIRAPLEELYRRIWITEQEVWGSTHYRQMLWRTVEHAWYACLHREMATSALMNLACRYQDIQHPFANGVMSFGQLLQRELEKFDFYGSGAHLNTFHYCGLHGRWAIRIKRGFEDHLNLIVQGG